jgi:regulator of RNase E activity RraA
MIPSAPATTASRRPASGAWRPSPALRPVGPAAPCAGRALTLRMESARQHAAAAGRASGDTRMAAIWHVLGRVARGDVLVVQCGDRRRVARVDETLFRYFRTEGGAAVVFDFEVENAADIARLGLAVWQRDADSGPEGDPLPLVAVAYDAPLELDAGVVRAGDVVELAPSLVAVP